MIDLKDDLFFTNTLFDREYKIADYVFIHTWGIYIADANYKYIRDKQYNKWVEINTQLKID
jgi:cytochrome oxidase Cu insertion factor (SCO1/SenC/PrrC family)